MKTISILGSTGSIGTQALEVAKMHKISVRALAAHSNAELLCAQAKEFGAEYVCIFDENKAKDVRDNLFGSKIKVLTGDEGLSQIANLDVDVMLNSIVGIAGLVPTLEGISHGTDIALANKETLVTGGSIVMSEAKKKEVKILPVDSEHSAIFQCLRGNDSRQVSKILLTASGGPFFGYTKEKLKSVTKEQALRHPNWSMGSKITIDSATLMNKGLEFIEAMRLFDLQPGQIEIIVHRESVLHSAVEYNDGSVIGQMGAPDMKIPIQYALLYPERLPCPAKRLSLTDYGTLTFAKPDLETFDCLSSCIQAAKQGGIMPTVVNGANEEAVKLFLADKIKFYQIGELVKGALEAFENRSVNSVSDILRADKEARLYVRDNA